MLEIGSLAMLFMLQLVERALAEVDPDGLGIDFNDFSMLLQRMPDFVSNFQMSI